MPIWLDELWPRVTVATGVGYLGVAYGVSRWLTRPSRAAVALPSRFALSRVELLRCTTCDGIHLKGWAVEPAAPRATVALFHGMRDNRSALLDRIAFLSAAGYRCVAFDHRAHGESAGSMTSFGYHERHDVQAVAELIRSRWPGQPCAALGVSMGAAALCFADVSAHDFQAIILESLYYDLPRAFQLRVGCGYPKWFRHFRRGVIWFTERRLGVPIEAIAPCAQIARFAATPVLLLTGSEDPHAPVHDVQALACKVPHTGRFHAIPGAGHGDVCTRGGSFYRELLLSFLERQLFAVRAVAAA